MKAFEYTKIELLGNAFVSPLCPNLPLFPQFGERGNATDWCMQWFAPVWWKTWLTFTFSLAWALISSANKDPILRAAFDSETISMSLWKFNAFISKLWVYGSQKIHGFATICFSDTADELLRLNVLNRILTNQFV